jgi:hypothetical protein
VRGLADGLRDADSLALVRGIRGVVAAVAALVLAAAVLLLILGAARPR